MAACNNAFSAERNLDACYEVDIKWSDYPKRLEKVMIYIYIYIYIYYSYIICKPTF